MANMAQAVRMALHFAEENYGVTDIFGQDVGPPMGGVFTATQGLRTSWNTPLDERGIVGMAMGLAMAGSRCVAEIQFCDYIFNSIDLLKMVGNTLWATNGQVPMPLVLMTPVGAGIRGSLYHSHSFDSWATRIPGWKVLMPSNPKDAYGLLLSAIKDPNPVFFLIPKALMRVRGNELIPGEPEDERLLKKMIDAPIGDRQTWKPEWPPLEEYLVEIGRASFLKEGHQLTLVSWGRHALICREVADRLQSEEGISAEVLDLRSLIPYDWDAICKSVKKTRRLLVVNEDSELTNFGEHLASRTTREFFYELDAAPRVLAAKNVPGVGLSPILEDATIPRDQEIAAEIRELVKELP